MSGHTCPGDHVTMSCISASHHITSCVYYHIYLSGQWVQLGVEIRNNRKNTGQLVVNKVVIILTIVESVQSQTVEESSFILGLSHNEWNLGKLALNQNILRSVWKNITINTGGKPAGE